MGPCLSYAAPGVPAGTRFIMARITIEDCTEVVPNRFHLVQMAAIRTKQLRKGAKPLVESEENRAVVVALREIAAGYVRADFAGASSALLAGL